MLSDDAVRLVGGPEAIAEVIVGVKVKQIEIVDEEEVITLATLVTV